MCQCAGARRATSLTCTGLVMLLAACVLAGGCTETPSATDTGSPSTSTAASTAVTSAPAVSSTTPPASPTGQHTDETEENGSGPVTVTVIYDNKIVSGADLPTGLQPGWGFACMVETEQTTVLFDTGSKGDVLLANLHALRIDPRSIDTLVLSHDHGDHTGGLAALLEQTGPLTIYHPASLSVATRRAISDGGATTVPVAEPITIGPGLLVTGTADGGAKGGVDEQALLVETVEGPLLITGCAHPGIVRMVETASAIIGVPVRAVVGGFHLVNVRATEAADIAARLAELGVVRCGPAHCTGEAATAALRRQFEAGFMEIGTGAVIVFADDYDS